MQNVTFKQKPIKYPKKIRLLDMQKIYENLLFECGSVLDQRLKKCPQPFGWGFFLFKETTYYETNLYGSQLFY